MTPLLCRLGLHHATWQPHGRASRETVIHIRTCTRCGQPLPRNHR